MLDSIQSQTYHCYKLKISTCFDLWILYVNAQFKFRIFQLVYIIYEKITSYGNAETIVGAQPRNKLDLCRQTVLEVPCSATLAIPKSLLETQTAFGHSQNHLRVRWGVSKK